MQVLTGVFFVMNRADSQQLDKYQEKLERLTDIALMFGMINDLKNDGEALRMRVHVIGRIVDNRFGPASLFDKVTVAARTQTTRSAAEPPKRQNA